MTIRVRLPRRAALHTRSPSATWSVGGRSRATTFVSLVPPEPLDPLAVDVTGDPSSGVPPRLAVPRHRRGRRRTASTARRPARPSRSADPDRRRPRELRDWEVELHRLAGRVDRDDVETARDLLRGNDRLLAAREGRRGRRVVAQGEEARRRRRLRSMREPDQGADQVTGRRPGLAVQRALRGQQGQQARRCRSPGRSWRCPVHAPASRPPSAPASSASRRGRLVASTSGVVAIGGYSQRLRTGASVPRRRSAAAAPTPWSRGSRGLAR